MLGTRDPEAGLTPDDSTEYSDPRLHGLPAGVVEEGIAKVERFADVMPYAEAMDLVFGPLPSSVIPPDPQELETIAPEAVPASQLPPDVVNRLGLKLYNEIKEFSNNPDISGLPPDERAARIAEYSAAFWDRESRGVLQ